MSVLPLEGLRVLEFSHTVMGPTAGLLFADLGAEVIKVEPAPKGDHTRKLAGFASGFFGALNRNKKSIAVNLKDPAGQQAVYELVKTADIVLENYGPGTMERLGCGYDTFEAINPKIIYLAMKGYLNGPYHHRAALDEVVQFHVGLAYMTGPPGRPLRAGASIIDILGAMFGVIGVQAALRERDVTGKGQRVSSALFESAVFLMGTHMAGLVASGQPLMPMPARRGAWAIYEVFDTADDGQLFIGVTSDQQWHRFIEEFDLQELGDDPRMATNESRSKERPWLLPKIQDVVKQFPQSEVAERCERANVSFAPVGEPADLFEDIHLLKSNGLLDVFVSPQGGEQGEKVGLPNLPLEFGSGKERTVLRSQPPSLGQHNREVMESAGLTPERIDILINGGVLVSSND